jgi:predicted nucleic acid-binding protein
VVVVDTSVWIDYLRGTDSPEARWLDVELDRQRLAITDLILCEVLQGVRGDAEAKAVRRELTKLEVFATGGAPLAIAAAESYRILRARGRTVRKTIDCLIATYCLREGHALLHRDRDFEPFEEILGLTIVHA